MVVGGSDEVGRNLGNRDTGPAVGVGCGRGWGGIPISSAVEIVYLTD